MGRNIRMKLVIQTIQNNQTKKTSLLKMNRIIQQILLMKINQIKRTLIRMIQLMKQILQIVIRIRQIIIRMLQIIIRMIQIVIRIQQIIILIQKITKQKQNKILI